MTRRGRLVLFLALNLVVFGLLSAFVGVPWLGSEATSANLWSNADLWQLLMLALSSTVLFGGRAALRGSGEPRRGGSLILATLAVATLVLFAVTGQIWWIPLAAGWTIAAIVVEVRSRGRVSGYLP
ncbi:MAG: hypothetical protein AAF581_09690 [Planctomycetota bacterium]